MKCAHRIFWVIMGILLGIAICKADPTVEAEALLILDRIQAEKSILAPKVAFADYISEQKKGWPDGALLFVSAENCRPCEIVNRKVFTDPAVIEKLSTYVVVRTPKGQYKKFQPRNNSQRRIEEQIWPPFLVKINPGGQMVQWMPCPVDPKSFLETVFPKPEEKR